MLKSVPVTRTMHHLLLRNIFHTGAKRRFSSTTFKNADFTHAVIGGGAVGLAVARQLQLRGGNSTVLIEKHGSVGTETSSRNSEVIHAGIYYGAETLKTELCLRGKKLMYGACEKFSIPYRNCGKWIVAQDEPQRQQLEKVYDHCTNVLQVPMRWVTEDEHQQREPAVRAEQGILESPTTGIIDSHAYMQYLQGSFEELDGICALGSSVTKVEPLGNNGSGGWEVFTTSADGEESSITAETLINSAGLFAISLSNMILPPERQMKAFYAKGSYFSYSSSQPKVSTLVYPAPVPGHGGLGTHLTLDLGGRMRFGPDVEWVDDPSDYTVNDSRLSEALDDIQSYLPSIDRNAIQLDYSGIRPKLAKASAVSSGKGFVDFYIKKEEGFEGFVNLLGIESPGLTSSMAIGEMVEKLLYGSSTDPLNGG